MLFSLSTFVSAHIALLALVWPLAGHLNPQPSLASRLHLAIVLSSACVLAGTLLFFLVGAGGRPLLAALPLLCAGLLRGWQSWAFPAPAVSGALREEKLLLAFLSVLLALLTLLGLVVPPFHYDSLSYHLPTAALAWQNLSLNVITAHPQIGANPILAELPKIWGFAFSGNDSLANLHQLPQIVGLSALTFALAAKLKAKPLFCLFAALAVPLVPKYFEQSFSPNVDLLAAFWGASAVILIGRKSYPLAFLALVIFAQQKYSTLLPALCGALYLFALRWRTGKLGAVCYLVVFALAGGAWEWRNLAVHENPTFPYVFEASGEALAPLRNAFPAWIVSEGAELPGKWDGYFINRIEAAATEGEKLLFPIRYWKAWGDFHAVPYDAFSGRWGPAFFLLAIPALFAFLALRMRRGREARWILIALAAYFLSVKSWEARLGFLILPFAFASAAWMLSVASRKSRLPARLIPAFTLLWCSAQIALAHPLPLLFKMPNQGLALTTKDPLSSDVIELASTIEKMNPDSLWIHFTQGHRHRYGMAITLLYPYFSRDWTRVVTIAGEENANNLAGEFKQKAPASVLLLEGSALSSLEGYRLVLQNKAGAVYEKH